MESTSSSWRSRSTSLCRAGSSSSTTRTRMHSRDMIALFLPEKTQRQQNLDLRTSFGAPLHLKVAVSVRVQRCDPRPCHRQPQTGRRFHYPRRGQSHTIVQDANLEAFLDALRGNGHRSHFRPSRDSVPYGILDERLNHQGGDRCVPHLWCDAALDLEMIAETDLLNREIVFEKRHFVGERNLLPVPRFQRQA